VHQRLREENENPIGPPRKVQAVQDEAGLDRLPQPHFIREKDPWRKARANLFDNRDLVRNGVDPASEKSPHGRLTDLRRAEKRLDPDIKSPQFIDLPAEQAIVRF